MTPVQGAVAAAAAVLDDAVRTVADVHAAIARKPFRVLNALPPTAPASTLVQLAHDGISGGVYAAVGAGVQLVGAAAQLAAGVLGPASEPRRGSAVDLAVAAINGFAGDRLTRDGNALATTMGLRHRGRAVAVQRAALSAAYPRPSRRVVLFVHGLACNENFWRPAVGGGAVDVGRRLARELGCSALYLRYNTGLPIADNGRELARLLSALVAEWPVPIDELVLVGHSMGGLVLRSAAHHGAGDEWTARVRHAFYLGSPHRGAPLEKAAHLGAWMLGWSDVTRPLATLVNRRSRGIKDLRFGAVRDEDCGEDPDALLDDRTADLPLLDGAAHHFVTATLTRDGDHPLGAMIGDWLVRRASASGRTAHASARVVHIGGVSHLALVGHSAVYELIRDTLRALD